jgi:hypothetical protein
MADNTHYYGFRWSVAANGGKACPVPERQHVASGQDDQDDSSNSVDLNVGDPVKRISTGGVTLAQTTDAVYGIIVAVAPYWDGTRMTPGNKLPNQTTWGTVEERRSYVYVVPVSAGVWEIDCDDKVTATTLAAYRALIGENAEHTTPGNTALTSADPYLDISGHATTATLSWRIVDVSPTLANEDFSGSYVKLLVQINESQQAGFPASGSIVAGV